MRPQLVERSRHRRTQQPCRDPTYSPHTPLEQDPAAGVRSARRTAHWSTTLAETTSEPTPQETRGQRARRTRRRAGLYTWMFVLVALLIVLIALAVQNTRPVEVSWVFGTGQVPLVWLIVFAAIVGWLTGIVTGTVIRRSTRRR